MKVTAALIWWNEAPDALDRCIRGLSTIADRVVAVDGAYARYPDATARSPKDQEDAIRKAAKDVGLEADVVIPTAIWPGGVAKRAFTLARAAEGSDWVVALDADWRIMGDREQVRAELANADRQDVFSALIFTPPSREEPATGWHIAQQGHSEWINHIYRALPGLTCERYHWWFSAIKNRRKVYLWGPKTEVAPLMPAYQLQSPYSIAHMTLHRTREQVLASRAFLNDRTMVVTLTGQEDDVPGLPAPEFDFKTIIDLHAQRAARRRLSPRERHKLRRQGIG